MTTTPTNPSSSASSQDTWTEADLEVALLLLVMLPIVSAIILW